MTLKGKGGGGRPEESPGPAGEPGRTAATTADERPPAWGQRERAGPGLGWPCGWPSDGRAWGSARGGDMTAVGRGQAEDTGGAAPRLGTDGGPEKETVEWDESCREHDKPRMADTADRSRRTGT